MNSRWYFSATFRTASFETETHQRNLSLMCHTSWHRFFHRLEGQSRRPAILIKRKLSYVRPLTYSYGQGNIPGLFWLQIPTVSSSPPPKVPSVNNLCKALPTFRRRWSICVYVCYIYISTLFFIAISLSLSLSLSLSDHQYITYDMTYDI